MWEPGACDYKTAGVHGVRADIPGPLDSRGRLSLYGL